MSREFSKLSVNFPQTLIIDTSCLEWTIQSPFQPRGKDRQAELRVIQATPQIVTDCKDRI